MVKLFWWCVGIRVTVFWYSVSGVCLLLLCGGDISLYTRCYILRNRCVWVVDKKLGVTSIKGHIVVTLIFESRSGKDGSIEFVDPLILHQYLKELRAKGRRIRLPDHPTLKSPMGYPHMCYGKAHGCSGCIKCIMGYYADEVIEAVAREKEKKKGDE